MCSDSQIGRRTNERARKPGLVRVLELPHLKPQVERRLCLFHREFRSQPPLVPPASILLGPEALLLSLIREYFSLSIDF